MEWIDADTQKPCWPCLSLDNNGNMHIIDAGLLILFKDEKPFYLDGKLYSRYHDEQNGKEEMQVCIYENRIRYWMNLPKVPKKKDEIGEGWQDCFL